MNLQISKASYVATKYACENYHYSKCLHSGKLISFGVWEDEKFKGVVIFSRGASPMIGKPFKLEQTQVVELTRVALKNHIIEVTRILSICLKMLKRHCPGLKLIVSYADLDQGHKGGIYKGGNWIYLGITAKGIGMYYLVDGEKKHNRLFSSHSTRKKLLWLKEKGRAIDFETLGKHKFVYLLADDIELKKLVDSMRQ